MQIFPVLFTFPRIVIGFVHMSLFWQREKKYADRRAALAGVPRLCPETEIVEVAKGLLKLKVPVPRGAGWFDRFRPAVREKIYELDEFGGFVVRQIDGRRDVLTIVDAFERRFGMSRREAELSVVAFFNMLIQRRVVSVVCGN